jgi:N6-adenosine-specific RNA methylase IME4
MYDDIAEETGYEKETLRQYKRISENIESGTRVPELSFMHHREVASLPPEKQELFLNMAVEDKLSVRDLREQIRRSSIEEKAVELPQNKYRIIYADPPWQYGNSMPEYFTEQANHYQLMTLEDICSMKIRDITEDNAVLFLWVTSPILEDAFRVIEAWGFKYKTSFVWDKIKHNMGHYNSVRHELLLVCVKGSCTPDNLKLFDSVVSIERTEHSVKPEYFREIIDTLYTSGKRIELFARTTVEGWEAYGNEA